MSMRLAALIRMAEVSSRLFSASSVAPALHCSNLVVSTAPKPNTPLPQSAVDVKLPLPVGLLGPHPPMAYEAVSGAGPSMGPTPVYHYIHPITGDRVVSLLPPNDPKMVCLQEGVHVRETRYGILGASLPNSPYILTSMIKLTL